MDYPNGFSVSRTRRSSFGLQTALLAPVADTTLPNLDHADGRAANLRAALPEAPLGRYWIAELLDGIAPFGRGFFFGDDAPSDATLAETGIGPETLPAPVRAYLLRSPDQTLLIDAAMGEIDLLGPDFQRLAAGLAAAGVAPADIDTAIVTHLHPEHIGGMLAGQGPPSPMRM